MKRIAAFVFIIFLFLLTSSCASSPNWTGTETQMGEFVWSPSPGIRFYINVILLGGLFVYFIYVGVQIIRDWQKGEGGTIGCLSFFLLIIGLILFGNVRDYIWSESFSINQERNERTFYPSIWKPAQQETLEWKDVSYIGYAPNKTFEHEVWIKVFRSTGKPAGGQTEKSTSGRAIILSGTKDREIVFALEKQYNDTSFPRFMINVWSWIFGTEDFAVAPEEERRLKAVINKYLPENLKETADNETKEYLNKQD